MFKIVIFPFLFLAVACKPPLKAVNTPAQPVPKTCNIPYMVSSDSLFRFAMHTHNTVVKTKPTYFSDSLLNLNFYTPTPKLLQDSFAKTCQTYLYHKLGEQLYCNNVYLIPNSFGITKGFKMDKRTLTFFFLMPTIASKRGNIWTGKYLEHTQFSFILDNGNPDYPHIIFPENVPDCSGSPDCKYVVNRDSAIAIAKRNNLISDTTKYTLTADGLYWRMSIDDAELNAARKIRIHMQTGKLEQEISYPANDANR